ncbi:DNA glycosylase [Amylostereum chailletii]|nr:DNA glycosylase [Amylostereum chailletii]
MSSRSQPPILNHCPCLQSFLLKRANSNPCFSPLSSHKRFEDIFSRLACKPYERLERVEPFKTLTSSILGQQISWIAARSVRHRFIRLYFPELPEKPDEQYWSTAEDDKFPSPQQVAKTEIAALRTAGLSGRKAEYVQDLAARFADGRLSGQKLFDANDEDLYEMLTAVRGIGRWTGEVSRCHFYGVLDMFAIFSLRRPDILPLGDLGVQRGVLRWFLSLHNPEERIDISPKKLPVPNDKPKPEEEDTTTAEDADTLPVLGPAGSAEAPSTPPPRTATLPSIDVPGQTPAKRKTKMPAPPAPTPSALGLPSFPPAFTPSINATLEGKNLKEEEGYLPVPLPSGLTTSEMKVRLGGKKKIKGAMLTPAEMEHLTEPWKPYRSIGVYYMWTLAEEAKDK